jgi:hypothetical protein
MAEDIGGLPLITIRFDADGALESAAEAHLLQELDRVEATDLLVFCHGWNNSTQIANLLFHSFFRSVPTLLAEHGKPDRRIALLGIHWPSQRWSDEPIPDFDVAGSVDLSASAQMFEPPPIPDAISWEVTRAAFDRRHRADVDELLALISTRPSDSAALKRARVLIRALAEAVPDPDDGERAETVTCLEIDDPFPDQVFADFVEQLDRHRVLTDSDDGTAGFGDSVARLWHGAQEVVRQITYWQMKARAAVVGERGLGSLIAQLQAVRPGLGINLIGHSFGARLVAFALKPMPDAPSTTAIRSAILLQGGLSHFAFSPQLPFDALRSGALAGLEARVDGPVIACYSPYDPATGDFYALTARAAGPDQGLSKDALSRWSALGHDGHQGQVPELTLQDVGVRQNFPAGLVNIDVGRVVRSGRPPSGAHSDICHPELAWMVLSAAGLVSA